MGRHFGLVPCRRPHKVRDHVLTIAGHLVVFTAAVLVLAAVLAVIG